jgi:hypothetical protein
MKSINTKNLDQDEARTLIAQLGLHAANLRGLLANSKAETIQPPKLAADDDIAGIGLLVNHVTDLENRLGGKAPAFNFSAARDAVTSELSVGKLIAPPLKKLSLTGRVLAARGVGSLSALREKLIDQTPEEKSNSARRLKTSAH